MTDARLLDLKFDAPPVVEVIFGLEFMPLPKFMIPHFGVYWNEVRSDYPECQVLPPLVSAAGVSFMTTPRVRCLFSNDKEQKAIQLQDDRFFYNWRKVTAAGEYPQYAVIEPLFVAEWSRLQRFLSTEALGDPNVLGCELSYVNHLSQGTEWHTLSDLPRIFSVIGDSDLARQTGIEQFNYLLTLPLRNAPGQITLQIQPAIVLEQGPILQFSLAVKGKPSTPTPAAIAAWFGVAHAAIRENFYAATTSDMHKLWKMRGDTK